MSRPLKKVEQISVVSDPRTDYNEKANNLHGNIHATTVIGARDKVRGMNSTRTPFHVESSFTTTAYSSCKDSKCWSSWCSWYLVHVPACLT